MPLNSKVNIIMQCSLICKKTFGTGFIFMVYTIVLKEQKRTDMNMSAANMGGTRQNQHMMIRKNPK